jgi:hypothetical protein
VLAAAVFAVSTSTAALVPVVDQQQTKADALLGTFRDFPAFAQSFVPSLEVLAGAGLVLEGPAEPSNAKIKLTLEVWSSLPDNGAQQPLVSVPLEGRPDEWADAFWNPVDVKPGGEYFLVFRDGTPQQSAPLGANDDLYPAGAGYFFNAGRFTPVAEFDFAFRTFAVPIPEPRTSVLLLAGLLVVAAISLRRRRSA